MLFLPALLVLPAPAPAQSPAANLGVSGTQVSILQPDPKRPGKFLFKIWAAGVTGAAPGDAVQGTLSHVTAVLFQQGAAAAQMRSPQAHAVATKTQQTVTATGGVQVVSLTQPGTTLSADKVTWQAKQNTVEAVGHVVYVSGKTGLTIRVPRLVADTSLKTFSSVGAGSGVLPGRKG